MSLRLGHDVVLRAGALRHLPALFRFAWAASRKLTSTSIGLRLLRATLPGLMLYVAKLLIDTVVAGRTFGHDPLVWTHWTSDLHLRHLALLVGVETGLAITSDLLSRATTSVEAVLAELTANAITLQLMAHAATLDLAQFEDATIQDQLERARRQISWRSNLISQLLARGQDLATAFSLAVAVVAVLPWLAMLLLLALIPAFVSELSFNRRGYRLAFKRSPERRELEYLRGLAAGAGSVKEVKLFGLTAFLSTRYQLLADRVLSENARLARHRALLGGSFASLGTIAYAVAYLTVAVRAIAGEMTVGDFTFLTGAFLRLRVLVEGLLLGASQLIAQARYLDDLFGFLAVRPQIHSPPHAVRLPAPIRQGFVFENVGYRYPGSARWAVRHLSLTIAAGEVVALVGENGAGKTTIVKLLARLYDPTEGRIMLDGCDLREIDLEQLRSRIGVIFQDFLRLDFTARDNIAVGRITALHDEKRITAAAASALADKVVAKLADGYGQQLGRRFEGGVELSGGEWQTIAIARAYMRDADVLILDEPTAALDARAEAEVFARFSDLAAGRTAILISHRFSTVRRANRIIVLANGTVVESGSHADLLTARGRYAELFELQAAGYR